MSGQLSDFAPAMAMNARGHGTESARVRLGSHSGTPADVLVQLTRDPAVTVRAAVAMNPACPAHVDLAISRDADERVRALLARKLALLVPSLSANGHAQACGQVLATLNVLAEDAAVRVRAVIADCMKAMPDVPHDLILKLAQDTALPVSEPIIRLSPLLTDADLLALLNAPSHPAAAACVASRPGLTAVVADAVAMHADGAAIRALLLNHSAAIREATLDALIEKAEPQISWHGPLVQRPVLTKHAILALSGFVATQLVEALARRAKLDPALTAELRRRVEARLEFGAATTFHMNDDELLTRARHLEGAGTLNEAMLLDSARAGDRRRVAAMLAVASGLPLAAVDRATSMRSVKGLVSLAWKAGFSMQAAVIVQATLGQVGVGGVMLAGPDGAFPLCVEEMQWQLEVLRQSGR